MQFSFVFGLVVLVFVVGTSCQRIIYPTYRPPPRQPPVIRTARAIEDNLAFVTDRQPALHDVEHARVERSLSTPGRGRVGSNGNRGGSRGQDTGATHPGYNRRNARSLYPGLPDFATTPPFNPKPWPGFPKPDSRPRFPVYV